MFKKLFIFITLVSSLLFLSCCKQPSATSQLSIGTIAGPETELMNTAKTVAQKKYGLDINIVEFTDYTLPNLALHDGSIDANMFQHLPYLQESIKSRGYKLVVIAKTFIYPMGLYSQKIKNLNQLAANALVIIPNDPSNSARALLLLEKSGLIKLRHQSGKSLRITDIIENNKNLQFKELDAAQLPRALHDADLAAINSNYAIPAGLYPFRDALSIEDKHSDYANLVVAREDNQNDPRLQKLILALHSPEVLAKAKELFKGQAIPAW